MKSGAYPASRMKPMYQARKKIVAGSTKRLRAAISSWNSGDSLDRLPVVLRIRCRHGSPVWLGW